MQFILTAAVLAVASAALLYLKKILDNQNLILRRIELLELLSRDGAPLERAAAGDPHDGLPIGAPFPDFQLHDMSDRPVTRESITKDGRPAILLFVGPTCVPCKALLPEIERWEAELGDRLNFLLMSSGSANDNKGKFGVFSDEVILQTEREVAEMVYARWTPTAIFVRADETIGSRPAAGDAAIRKLIDHVRSVDLRSNDIFFAGDGRNGGGPQVVIGERLPEFNLEDIKGNEVTAKAVVGKRTLAVFWSPTCPHCSAMMSELQEWDRNRTATDPNLIVFSDGELGAHAGLELSAPVVLDSGYKTSAKIGMYGTPSAVILDESGTVVTETAMGASNIWALVGKRR